MNISFKKMKKSRTSYKEPYLTKYLVYNYIPFSFKTAEYPIRTRYSNKIKLSFDFEAMFDKESFPLLIEHEFNTKTFKFWDDKIDDMYNE